jgi:hypothetical protein
MGTKQETEGIWNWVLKRVFGPTRHGLNFLNGELHTVFCLPSTVMEIKLVRLDGHVDCMNKLRYLWNLLVKGSLWDNCADWTVILNGPKGNQMTNDELVLHSWINRQPQESVQDTSHNDSNTKTVSTMKLIRAVILQAFPHSGND